MYFWNYRLSKTCLNHSLEIRCFRTSFDSQRVNGAKQLWNAHESTFIIFFDDSEGKWFKKYLPYWTFKSWGCMLTHWLPMRTIPLGIVGICSSILKCNYLQNKTPFMNFLFHLWNLHENVNIFKKTIVVIANVFPRLKTVKDLVKPLSKNHHFRRSFGSQHVKGSQTLVKSSWEIFYSTRSHT